MKETATENQIEKVAINETVRIDMAQTGSTENTKEKR